MIPARHASLRASAAVMPPPVSSEHTPRSGEACQELVEGHRTTTVAPTPPWVGNQWASTASMICVNATP